MDLTEKETRNLLTRRWKYPKNDKWKAWLGIGLLVAAPVVGYVNFSLTRAIGMSLILGVILYLPAYILLVFTDRQMRLDVDKQMREIITQQEGAVKTE
jgi:hypothetical protein